MDNATDLMKDGGRLALIKCELVDSQFRRRGTSITLSLKEALNKFTPDSKVGSVLLRVKCGQYIGLADNGKFLECFVISNKNTKGDISWLLNKKPNFGASIKEVYLVQDIDKPSSIVEKTAGI